MAIQIQTPAVCFVLCRAQRMQVAGWVRVLVCVDRNAVSETSSQGFKNNLLGSTEVGGASVTNPTGSHLPAIPTAC